MITGLANLGPSLKGSTGLGAERVKGLDKEINKPFEIDSQKQAGTSSFDSVLNEKVNNSKLDDRVNISTKADPRTDRPERIKNKETVIPNETGDRTVEPKQIEESENEVVDSKGNEKVRQKVMLEFMDSMESEFGIPPEDIAEAMTKIPTDQALKSPDKTASQVIDKLDLPEEDESRALELYLGMLEQLKQVQNPPVASKPTLAAAGMLGGSAVLASQSKRSALNNSLDRMNEQFFLRGQYAPQIKAQVQPMQMMNQGPLGQEMLATQLKADPSQLQMDPSMLQNEAASVPSQIPEPQFTNVNEAQDALPLEGMQEIDPDSAEAKALLSALATLGASAAALEKGLPKDPQTQQALKAEQLMNQLKAEGIVAPKMQASDVKSVAGLGLAAEGDDSDEQADLSNSDQFFVHNESQSHKAGQRELGQIGDKDFAAALGGASVAKAASPQQETANTQRLMNSAQYLLKKGGGEAKIQMAPEGIGQVHMKMTLLDGKVNLEMQAETKEAKKLIESSMGELKTQLGQHNLTMDRVKVDVGNQTSMDTRGDSQQRGFDSQQQPSKDQTRNFWNQFNGNGTGGFERRNGFNENTGIRAYGGTRRQEPLKAVDSNVTPSARSTGSGKGRGLNLVA